MVLLFLIPIYIQAQTFNLKNTESTVTVFGTSSLHDWHVVAETKSGQIIFKDLETGELETCTLDVVSQSLKSGKKAMDKNTYKALKTETYKSIFFQLTSVQSIIDKGIGKFLIKCQGDLTITNVKKQIPIEFTIEIIQDKIIVTGSKSIKMTDFNIEPPTALLGTIRTGNEITIQFKTIYK